MTRIGKYTADYSSVPTEIIQSDDSELNALYERSKAVEARVADKNASAPASTRIIERAAVLRKAKPRKNADIAAIRRSIVEQYRKTLAYLAGKRD